MNDIRTVCIYCASSTRVADEYVNVARDLGRLLAERDIRLVNGAGCLGLMKECSDACLEVGGRVTGVIPRFMIEQGWHHTGLTELIETPDMHVRKQTMMRLADGAIALPGGCGTMEELLEVITWKQLGLYPHPIVILNTSDFYHHLLEQLRQAVDERFMRPEHAGIWQVAQTPEEALRLLFETPLWDENVRKFAAI
ncbi:MAG: TIGR00730 family Rossman fold protein [Paraprevotella sp.]|nr:TIGR00730 family Rossman fold protein [Paraprevotella sp.]